MDKSKLIKIKVTDTGGEQVYFDYNNKLKIEYKQNINTFDTEKNISWYYHDVYKKLTYLLWNPSDGRMYLDSSKLFSKTKLLKLSKTKSFKNEDFAFFKYGYVQKLLGITQTSNGMSGLMAKGTSL